MDSQKRLELSQKLYGIIESFKEEWALSGEEIKELIMDAHAGF